MSECTSGYTLSAWLNLGTLRGVVGFLVSSGGETRKINTGGFALFHKRHGVVGAVVRIRSRALEWITEDSPVPVGGWFHVAATWGVDGVIKLYINGAEKSSVAGRHYNPERARTPPNVMNLGRTYYDGYYANGTMDELRIWTQELNENEIKQTLGRCKCNYVLYMNLIFYRIVDIKVDICSNFDYIFSTVHLHLPMNAIVDNKLQELFMVAQPWCLVWWGML